MNKIKDLNESFECKGYWWLPCNPEKKIAGTLTYKPNEKINLEIIGTFYSGNIDITLCDKITGESIIHGLTSDSQKITLINCHSYASLNLSCPFPIVNYKCQFIVVGKHLDSYDEECFHEACLTFPGLSNWCPPCILERSISDNNNQGLISVAISFNNQNILINSTNIDENTTLNIECDITYQDDNLSPQIEQFTYIKILKKHDSSIKDFLPQIHLYEQLLSLATLQTINCSKIILHDKTLYQQYDNGKKFDNPIKLFYIQRNVNDIYTNKRYDYLFDYNSISQQYSKIIYKWYNEKENIAPIKRHLIDSIKNKPVFTSIDFLIVIQAIEGFCSRFRKEDSLNEMLKAIITEFSVIDKLKNDNINIEQVVDSRHYYSHFFMKSKKKHIIEGQELYVLTFKLRKLLICCVLNFIGLDYNEINNLLNHSCNYIFDRLE